MSITSWSWAEIQIKPSSVVVLRYGFPCVHVRPKCVGRVEEKVEMKHEAVQVGVLENKD